MNILLFSELDKITPNIIRISDHRYLHLKKRQQHTSSPDITTGNSLRIGEINGNMGFGNIIDFNDSFIELELGPLNDEPPTPNDVTLIIALPRPKMLKRIFREATTLGIKQFYIINTFKVDKSYWSSPVLETENLKRFLLEGLEQCIDTQLPVIHFKRFFKPFVEDDLPTLSSGKKGYVAHPSDVESCPAAFASPTIIAIGPEGGFTDYEIEKFSDCGFESISLGKRILKVETAIPVLVGRSI